MVCRPKRYVTMMLWERSDSLNFLPISISSLALCSKPTISPGMRSILRRMRDRILRHADPNSWQTAVPRVLAAVVERRNSPASTMCGPGFCLVLQGAKHMEIGGEVLRQEAGSSFASLIALPANRCVFERSLGQPYVSTGLELNYDMLGTLLADVPASSLRFASPNFTIASGDADLLEAWDRLLELLDRPKDIPAIAEARERELLYRLLESVHGPLLRQLALETDARAQIRRAIAWLRLNFDKALPISFLADTASMSIPSFNRHFRAVTSTSPLQYQKMLRLQSARQLLKADSDVAQAAYAVGYESASQFSREYSRVFGLSPKRDAVSLRMER